MISETIITGLCCLFLAILFFRFKPHFFVLLSRLVRINIGDTKNLQYSDQAVDSEISTDIKPETRIQSWLTLPSEKFLTLIFIFTIFSFLIYISLNSLSSTLVQLGNNEFSAGHEKLGAAAYNLALEFNEDLKEAVNKCSIYNIQKQYKLAITHCNKAIEINENYITAYTYRGLSYKSLKQYDQAFADFSKVIKLIPIATSAYINRGAVYIDQNKYDLAIAEFTKSININPKEPQAWFNRGLCYDMQDKKDLAVSDYTKAIEIDSSYAVYYSSRGTIYAAQKEYDLAISDFSKVIEIDVNNVDAYIWRGNAFADSKNFAKAIADYQQALAITNDPRAKSYIYCVQGITYTKMGEFKSAIISLEEGIKLDNTGQGDWCKSVLENARQEIPTP